jgi:hypothetical protein
MPGRAKYTQDHPVISAMRHLFSALPPATPSISLEVRRAEARAYSQRECRSNKR